MSVFFDSIDNLTPIRIEAPPAGTLGFYHLPLFKITTDNTFDYWKAYDSLGEVIDPTAKLTVLVDAYYNISPTKFKPSYDISDIVPCNNRNAFGALMSAIRIETYTTDNIYYILESESALFPYIFDDIKPIPSVKGIPFKELLNENVYNTPLFNFKNSKCTYGFIHNENHIGISTQSQITFRYEMPIPELYVPKTYIYYSEYGTNIINTICITEVL